MHSNLLHPRLAHPHPLTFQTGWTLTPSLQHLPPHQHLQYLLSPTQTDGQIDPPAVKNSASQLHCHSPALHSSVQTLLSCLCELSSSEAYCCESEAVRRPFIPRISFKKIFIWM